MSGKSGWHVFRRRSLSILPLVFIAFGCALSDETLPGEGFVLPNTAEPYLNATGHNVLPLKIGGSRVCGHSTYPNEPCTTITLCIPGTSTCQTIPDMLVDTGSTGVRVFSSILTLPLELETKSEGDIVAACAQFGTGTDWGPLALADIVLGTEPAVKLPIQLIERNFAQSPAECAQSDISPESSGYNGILGIGLFQQDCGRLCTATSGSKVYYACSGNSCRSIEVPLTEQLQNPVSLLPADNNGVLLALPQIDPLGASTVTGTLILGIGTQSNNTPQGDITAYPADSIGNFVTLFNGKVLPGSFIDSGTNGLLFPSTTDLQVCDSHGPAANFYCPSSAKLLTAITAGASGFPATSVPFSVLSAETLITGSGTAFFNLGGVSPNFFDWGLPFFYGRAVFVGIENKVSSLGTGPYWAY